MLCKGSYKYVIIMRFLLHKRIVPKCSWLCFIKTGH